MMTSGMSRRGFLRSSVAVAGTTWVAAHDERAAFATTIEAEKMSIWDLPTPALLVDLDGMESNLRKMADLYRSKKAGLRPHGKTHKCPIIAGKQMALGAVGVCAAKVSEAEVFVEGGLTRVLITSPIVTADKIARVVALAKKSADVQVVVDQPGQLALFNDAAAAAGVKLSVVIDLNVGTRRTGVLPGDAAFELLQAIGRQPALRFAGLQAYAGHLMHVVGFEERKTRSEQALVPALEFKHRVEKAGFDVPIFTVGGTGTYNVDGDIPGVTDVQVGSYIFMDVNYRNVGGIGGPVFDDFRPSLLVLATAISETEKGRITIDAGYKAFATDHEPPELLDETGITYRWAGDEHGILEMKEPSRSIKVGDKLLLIASHCDPTVNLYDQFHAFRGERVEEVWPIAARGKSQ